MAAGLSSLLRTADGFELAAVCQGLSELRAAVAAVAPQIVLMDFTSELPPGVLGQLDASLLRISVVLWVYQIPAEMALHAMSLGVRGILRSTLPPKMVLRCLEKVQQGELWFENALVDDYFDVRKSGLSGREVQLIRLLAMGLKNKEIAGSLSITEGTVKVYLSRLFQKLGVKDRFELALFGLKNPADGAFHPSRPELARRARLRQRTLEPDFD